jgi:methylmalonyl-CoA mutase N-terminal domain/subunit
MSKKKRAATINRVSSKEIADTLISVKQNRGFDPTNDMDYFFQDDLKRAKWEKVVEPEKMQKIITDILAWCTNFVEKFRT